MKVFLGIKFHSDNSNRDTIESISQVLQSCGFETVCNRRDVEKWGAVSFLSSRANDQGVRGNTFVSACGY